MPDQLLELAKNAAFGLGAVTALMIFYVRPALYRMLDQLQKHESQIATALDRLAETNEKLTAFLTDISQRLDDVRRQVSRRDQPMLLAWDHKRNQTWPVA